MLCEVLCIVCDIQFASAFIKSQLDRPTLNKGQHFLQNYNKKISLFSCVTALQPAPLKTVSKSRRPVCIRTDYRGMQ